MDKNLYLELEPTIKNQCDRLNFEEQLKFIMGRENGEFLPRLMEYSQSLDRWRGVNPDTRSHPDLIRNGSLKQKIHIFNHEYHKNCCRVCGYYVFASGCEYCGTSRKQHDFNSSKSITLCAI